ncbi:uncharacterized protein LOC123527285 [Mercenaria mercenaria]|uniref:uncharacterized protein LOC123527285 n=1 Tax=Mercenaria mercenaria TaxID=6596 RepID=UPI00234E3A20|nr:uncharacterized protein LOC123527285 [Mercenaria mercenaria]XP_045162580.2 uncharacterized protein LOC123527285 [Mercenaria mercenaria]XP_045162581.2 uncharacterized protein LOC123527285 [Mercenaria mercenaria]XP_045162582.2 uncharacterized protein LOC123527285 [Mercenaria mercenaria]
MTTYSTESDTADYNYTYDYEDEYMYPGYKFERPVYLYLWEVLVVVTFFQNLLILSVFMRRKMRNPTNVVLSAIAISDTLTGLVTLPTYIMVYQRFDPLRIYDYDDTFTNQTNEIYKYNSSMGYNLFQTTSSFNLSVGDSNSTDNHYIVTASPAHLSASAWYSEVENDGNILSPTVYLQPTLPPVDGYILSKSLCRGFMISKYFLSKSFHTVSIFLTLFLEIQRYVSMAYPYRYETCFNRFKIVKIYCVSVFILSPFLHAFHLGSEKAVEGLCQWELPGYGCGKDCIYLWIAFILRHFIPCVTLLTFTLLFIYQLRKGEENFRRVDSNSSQYSRRVQENRRISFVVTTVVVVRLIPEIPYSILLLYNSYDVTVNMGVGIDLETNRIYHMCYEICLVFSFLANFYIYLVVNKSFRKCLYRTFIKPLRAHLRDSFRSNDSASSSRKITMTKICSVHTDKVHEIKTIHSNILDKQALSDKQSVTNKQSVSDNLIVSDKMLNRETKFR